MAESQNVRPGAGTGGGSLPDSVLSAGALFGSVPASGGRVLEPSRSVQKPRGVPWSHFGESKIRYRYLAAILESPKTFPGTVETSGRLQKAREVPGRHFGESKNLAGYSGAILESQNSSIGTPQGFWRVRNRREAALNHPKRIKTSDFAPRPVLGGPRDGPPHLLPAAEGPQTVNDNEKG